MYLFISLITVDGKEVHSKADNGQKFKDYEYKLTGFDKDGKENFRWKLVFLYFFPS
jgi:uncharacterized protein YxeA